MALCQNAGTTSVSAEETEQHLGDADQVENCEIHIMFGHGDTETSEIIATVVSLATTRHNTLWWRSNGWNQRPVV